MEPPARDEQEASGASQRVIKVFVYDLAAPGIVLLDRFHQSVGFPGEDIVVAVQTRAPQALVDFSCDGRSLAFDARDASRATLASLLTTVWAIAPTYHQWSPAKRDVEFDYLLAVGGDQPFGLFTQRNDMHWGIRDAALRHMLLSDLHWSLSHLSSLFPVRYTAATGSSHGLPPALVDAHLYASDHVDFARRFAVLSWKLSKAQHWLSLKRIDQAWVYVEAMRTDAAELRRRIAAELDTLRQHSSLVCGPAADASAGEVAGLHSPAQAADSTSALLSATHYLFFVLVEVCLLLSIVGCFYVGTTYPHVFRPFVTRWVPRDILRRFDDSKRKHHA